MQEELTEKKIIDEVIGKLHMPKFIKMNYLEKNIDATIEYLQKILQKLDESRQIELGEDLNTKKIVLDVLTELLIYKGLNNVIYSHDNMLDLLRFIDKKRYLLVDDVTEILKIKRWTVKSILKPLADWKILQSVTIPTLEGNYWARAYGWYGDTVVHDYLINQVYNLIHSYSLEIEIQPNYSFTYEFAGKQYEKVTDGKIAFKGRHYILEILTNVAQKPKKELEEQLLIYGEFVKNSYPKKMIIITENRETKYQILGYIRKQQHYLRKHFCLFNFCQSEIKKLENLILYGDRFYGQKNKMN